MPDSIIENKSWQDRVKFVIGFLIPAIPAAAVLVYIDTRFVLSSIQLPLWAHVTITGGSLLLALGIVVWALRGGIPPRY